MSLLNVMISAYLADGEIPVPMGTAYKALLPYQTFRTQSRDIALAVGSQKLWKIFCPLIGRPDLADDPRFATNAARVRHRGKLIDVIQQVLLTKTYEEWEAIFLEAGVPVGAINDVAQLLEHPQVKARGAMVDMVHPRAGPVKMVGVPVKLSATPGAVRTPSPCLGEHSAQTLREVLGLPDEEIRRLMAAGVVHGPPAAG